MVLSPAEGGGISPLFPEIKGAQQGGTIRHKYCRTIEAF
jgi:hypothetical protein